MEMMEENWIKKMSKQRHEYKSDEHDNNENTQPCIS